MIISYVFVCDVGYPKKDMCFYSFINYVFYRGFSPFFKRNSIKILVEFLVYVILISLIILYICLYSDFKWVMIINSALRVLERHSKKLGSTQGNTTVVTCLTPRLWRDKLTKREKERRDTN